MQTSLLDKPLGIEPLLPQGNASQTLLIASLLDRTQHLTDKIDHLISLLPQQQSEKETANYHEVLPTCKRYKISRPTLYRWIKKGDVKVLRIGSVIRLDWNSIDKLVDKRKTR